MAAVSAHPDSSGRPETTLWVPFRILRRPDEIGRDGPPRSRLLLDFCEFAS